MASVSAQEEVESLEVKGQRVPSLEEDRHVGAMFPYAQTPYSATETRSFGKSRLSSLAAPSAQRKTGLNGLAVGGMGPNWLCVYRGVRQAG